MQEMQVWSLGQEDLLEEKWQLNPVFLPVESQGQRSLVGYSLWGLKESDMTKWQSMVWHGKVGEGIRHSRRWNLGYTTHRLQNQIWSIPVRQEPQTSIISPGFELWSLVLYKTSRYKEGSRRKRTKKAKNGSSSWTIHYNWESYENNWCHKRQTLNTPQRSFSSEKFKIIKQFP